MQMPLPYTPENNVMEENAERIETSRLWLKPTDLEDAAFMLALLNCESWIKYIGDRNVHTVEAAEQYIAEKILPVKNHPPVGNYIVISKKDNTKLGTAGIYKRPDLDAPDIGFAFLPEYTGQGYAYEAAVVLRDMAFALPTITVLQAITVPYNHPSKKLLQKLGFSYVKSFNLEGDPEELMLLALHRETWNKIRTT